jgi:metal-dependent hydrolase (beta-lactamase superfamily II)
LSNGEDGQNPLGFCYKTEIIFRNFDLLEIKPRKISGCVLSHANRDHSAGMDGFVDKFLNQMRDDMRLFTGEESVSEDR